MERVIASSLPHKEIMSALLPHLSDPWHFGYCTLDETLAPIDDLLVCSVTPHNPGQTSNTIVSNPRTFSSPPTPCIGGKNPQLKWYQYIPTLGGNPRRELRYLLVVFILVPDRPLL